MKSMLNIVEENLEMLEEGNKIITMNKEELTRLKKIYEKKIKNVESNLKQLDGIEYKLYYEMEVNGLNPNKAVEKVARNVNASTSTIWKSYYPKVKAYIKDD